MCTCIGKISGTPLKKYYSESEAHEAVLYVKYNHGKEMTQYLCDNCGMWHLSPISRATPSFTCSRCESNKRVPKETYRSKQEALMRAEIIQEEKGLYLSVYPCPFNEGWHLTKG